MTPPLIILIWIAGIVTGALSAYIGLRLGLRHKYEAEAERQALQVLREARDTELAALRKMSGLS